MASQPFRGLTSPPESQARSAMPETASLTSVVDHLTEIVIEVTRREMRAAAWAIAAAITERYPSASTARLSDSDQGDWLHLEDYLDSGQWQPIELDLMDEIGHLASHLYLPHLDAVTGLTVSHGRPGRGAEYLLDLRAVQAAPEDRSLIEVLVVRDPDGPTTVTTAIAGTWAPERDVDVTHVDAGAGWEWTDWVEHRDQSLSTVSKALRERVVEAFDGPPGGGYITGRDGRPWLSGGL